MIKVGVLSMQRILNYGSFLQAYGLKCILEELGCEVQFVDYHPGPCLVPATKGKHGFSRKVQKAWESLCGDAPIKEKLHFIQHKKNYARKYYPLLGITDARNYSPKLDILVIGSDEVFNCIQNNSNVGYSPELFGVGANARRVVSYAASFGNTTKEKLVQFKKAEEIGKWLGRLHSISVRDQNSATIVSSLTGAPPPIHLDPVLIFDFINQCRSIPQSVPESNYLLLYGYSGRFSKSECEEIRKYAHGQGLKILCIGGVQSCCDKFIDCNPFEVIAYFQNASCIITDTFHGTILSVITHSKFAVFVRNQEYGNVHKLSDLLLRLGITAQAITNIDFLKETLEREIPYEDIDAYLQAERIRTGNYFMEQLHGI